MIRQPGRFQPQHHIGKLKAKLAELAENAEAPNIPPNQPPEGFEVPEVWGESN